MQAGWFGQIIKEKFNMELTIIAPQVAGDAIFQTRASSGNLGDILILEPIVFKDSITAGLVKDITAEIQNLPSLMS
jgi:multiple sugar transport system substrate-binding protein/putative aldouronate transport system substrate-binding protein